MVRPSRQDTHVWLISTVLATAGALLLWRGPVLPQLEPEVWWPVLAAVFALTERSVVHLPFGRDNHTLTFSEAPLVLGLLFFPATDVALACVVGGVVTYVLIYRDPPIKTAFNLACSFAGSAVAITVYDLLLHSAGAARTPLSPAGWLVAVAATLACGLVTHFAIFSVISLRSGRWEAGTFLRTLLSAAVGTVVVTDLALITALLLQQRPWALVLLGVLATLCFALYRGFHVQRLRYGRLELLYQFTRSVDASLQDESVLETVKREARALLRANHAQVMVCPDPDSLRLRGGEPPWWAAACDGEVVRCEAGRRGEQHEALRGSGFPDAMAAPLRDGGRVSGVLVVAGRLDDVSTFDDEDARLFEALAGHASVALANSGLVERVRAAAQETEHLSLHDPLTGLPNRLHFQQRLEQRLLGTGSAAVLLMDVDRFKEVNDTLGHDVGDQLLQQVGHRLRRLEHDETVVARLGGDEFAILLGDDDVHVEGMLARITRDFSLPFDVGDVKLDVNASIGIAVAPRDGSSAALLLRRAEVAMYDAKHRLTGVATYSSERDPYSARRLSLSSDLARALDDGTLEVHYQPQAEPATGQVVGVEALVRWKHPVWGQVPPDEFVPLAEHTGLIRPLTRFVTETAVRQCAAWRDAGTPVTMAVNISMRNLLEAELADAVARLLVKVGLPARLFKLEVTEGAIVADPERVGHALQRLVDLGLSVSVDDFGTGHSSLTRLRNLPVHEVKIDRAFVRHLADSSDDLAIVRAVIGLGHELGLHVVAEGVEDERSWRILAALECDLLQGYLLARPMPAEDMTCWLREHFAGFATRLHQDSNEPGGPAEPAATRGPGADPLTWSRRTGGAGS